MILLAEYREVLQEARKKNRERSLLSKGAFCDCLSLITWAVSQSLQNGPPPDLSLHIEIGVLQ